MLYRLTLLLVCLCAVNVSAAERAVKVLIGKNLDGATIEVTGAYNVYDPNGGARVGTAFLGKGRFMQPIAYGIRWGEEFPGTYQIKLTPDHPNTTILVNGIQYLGTLTCYQVDGKLQLVNTVPVEEYLRSVLSAKFDESMGQEVLNALAIVERTNVYHQISQGTNSYWQVDAEAAGYHGHAVFSLFDGARNAVESTRGIVMQHPKSESDDRTFAASWTRNSAGRTAAYQVMRRKDPGAPIAAVDTPYAARDRNRSAWTAEASLSELAKLGNLSRVDNLRLVVDEPSGKVYRLQLEGSQGSRDLDFYDFQTSLGKDRIRSAGFTASVRGERVIFTGVGEGDGVGLCLYEAQKMAERGDKANQILSYFFPGVAIELLRPEKEPRKKLADEKRYQHERGLRRMQLRGQG